MAKKRYADGGEMDEGSVDTNEPGMKEAEPEENFKPTSFKDAFASARKAGNKTFMWQGKSYTTEVAGEKKAAPKAESKAEPKKELKYQSLQDRKRDYEAAREKSGVSMYGFSKREPEERKALPLKSTKSESGYTGMGSLKFAKGGSASSRADGIAMRGKTRGKMR